MTDTTIFNAVPTWILVVLAGLVALNLMVPPEEKSKRSRGTRNERRRKPGFFTWLFRKLFFGEREETEEAADVTQYKTARFLTPTELRFFHVLSRIIPSHHYLGVKPRLVDLLEPSVKSRRLFNRVRAKHVHFVIGDRTPMRPILAIELDDWTHQREEAQRSDRFKDEIFHHAGLPLLRVAVASSYSDENLRVLVHRALQEAAEPHRYAA